MAKKDERKAKSNGNGQNTVQGFVFGINLKGTENVVMEGIKAFTQAMEKTGVSLAPPVTRPALAPGKKTGAAVIDQELEGVVDETPEEGVLETETEEEESESAGNDNGSKPTRRVPKTPTVLNDIDFNTGKVMPLKDFVTQKNPSNDYERYATLAVWYKENHQQEEVNADRIYTAYRFMDWVPPNDVAQVLRDLKSSPSKKWFDKGSGKGAYKVNIIGMNKVQAGFGN
ncbi:MAG TPA: hypothetical protein VN950_05205 [Terriglobales bacterium]|nr:hypothetical protein [Terriglobales bacterium]